MKRILAGSLLDYNMEPLQDLGIGNLRLNVPHLLGQSANFDHDTPIMIDDTQLERIEGVARPTGGISDEGPAEFVLPPMGDTFLMMGSMYLYSKLQIQTEGGTMIEDTDVVAPVNLLGATMWESIETSVDDVTISGSSGNFVNYKAMIESLLSYEAGTKTSHMRTQFFHPDTAGAYDDFGNADTDKNKGFKTRYGWSGKNVFDMVAPINSDLVKADTHLKAGRKLTLKFFKARDNFLLCSDVNKNFRLRVIDLKLFYHRLRLRPDMKISPRERYVFTQTNLKRYPLPAGLEYFNTSIQRDGKIPKTIVIGMVKTAAAEGTYATNPFCFEPFKLSQICLSVGGKRVPSEPLQPDFESGLLSREYAHLFINTGGYRVDRSNCVTLDQFKNGMTLFPFDLSPDLCNQAHVHPSPVSHVELELHWSEALAAPITIFVYMSFEAVLTRKSGELDFTREII